MAQRPPPPASHSGPVRPSAHLHSNYGGSDQLSSASARPRTALGPSRTALHVSSDDDSDGVIRQDGGTFVAPLPARGSTPSVSRPVVRKLELPDRQQVQRMAISDDGSANESGDVSGASHRTLRRNSHVVMLLSR